MYSQLNAPYAAALITERHREAERARLVAVARAGRRLLRTGAVPRRDVGCEPR